MGYRLYAKPADMLREALFGGVRHDTFWALRDVSLNVYEGQRLGIRVQQGVYAALSGPTYETPAEICFLKAIGADLVGMSTVPEVIVARAIGLRVLGFSCVTNLASGLSKAPITHAEVLEITAKVASKLERLVRGVVAKL